MQPLEWDWEDKEIFAILDEICIVNKQNPLSMSLNLPCMTDLLYDRQLSLSTTDLNDTGSRIHWPEVKPKKITYLEYQDGGRFVLQDVSVSYEQYQKEIIGTKA